MLPPQVYLDTVVELWCIDGGPAGYYIALKVDGQPGKAFKFIGKCSWEGGLNSFSGPPPSATAPLSGNITQTSTDPKTGNYWKYTYHPELGSIVAEKFAADGTLKHAETFMAKSQPFNYNDLPGDRDPTFCVYVPNNPQAGPAAITLPARSSYAAKFLCGYSQLSTENAPKEPPVKKGNYATVINIHNPCEHDVVVLKKVAIAVPESIPAPNKVQMAQRPTRRFRTTLPSDHATAIGCDQIVGLLATSGIPPRGAFIEGFLVIDAFSDNGTPADLDVVAVTTISGTLGGAVSDHQVVTVPGKRLPPGIWPY